MTSVVGSRQLDKSCSLIRKAGKEECGREKARGSLDHHAAIGWCREVLGRHGSHALRTALAATREVTGGVSSYRGDMGGTIEVAGREHLHVRGW